LVEILLLRADLVLLAASVPGYAEAGEIEHHLLAEALTGNIIDVSICYSFTRSQWHRRSEGRSMAGAGYAIGASHIRSANKGDLARLARIIVGRANNLVLSGGGARAFAKLVRCAP